MKRFLCVLYLVSACIGCEVTPFRHIYTTPDSTIEMRCAFVGPVPVMCVFFQETVIEVPVKVLVEVIVEKVVEVERIVEVEKIVEVIKTEYVQRDVDVDEFVQKVIALLPPGTTRETYNPPEVVAAVEEILLTYTPPASPTEIVNTGVSLPEEPEPMSSVPEPADTEVSTEIVTTAAIVNTPVARPMPVNENPQKISVDGGSSGAAGTTALTIRTGEHDPYICEGEHLTTTAYQDTGVRRQHQHWGACQVGEDIVIFLDDHPALTCGVGPNTHELEIEGIGRVTVEEACR